MTTQTLRRYRLLLGLTTSECSAKFGVAQRTWQCYEQGTRRIPAEIAANMLALVRLADPEICALLDAAKPIAVLCDDEQEETKRMVRPTDKKPSKNLL